MWGTLAGGVSARSWEEAEGVSTAAVMLLLTFGADSGKGANSPGGRSVKPVVGV